MLANNELPETEIEKELESRKFLDEDLETRGWRIFSDYEDVDPLEIFEQEGSEGKVIYAESNVFENMLGYTKKELLEPLKEKYSLDLDPENIKSFEYGNGWAIFHKEE